MPLRIGILQPPYPQGNDVTKNAEDVMRWMVQTIRQTTTPHDLLVLPEYANCPGIDRCASLRPFVESHTDAFLTQLAELAKEKSANIAVNVIRRKDSQYFNTTLLFSRDGALLGEYDKTHLSQHEITEFGLTAGTGAAFVEHEGLRWSFATCFEIYFPEYMEAIAAQRPDVIIFPSYQRSEETPIIRKQAMGRALDTEAFLLRASYALGEESMTGGASLVASPAGTILLDAEQQVGLFSCTIDPQEKRPRPVAHGLPCQNSRHIIETFRQPQWYRPAGPGVLGHPRPFPRVVAHRGLSGLCPENTLPAFGAAIALGADEIEFDLWGSRDGELVVCHDPDISRTSNGTGTVEALDWSTIASFDAGSWFAPEWTGVPVCRFQDILREFAGRIEMNIHVKAPGADGWVIRKIRDLAADFGVTKHIYLAGHRDVLAWARELAPDIARCCLDELQNLTIVQHAIEYDCQRVQFFDPYYTEALIQEAHSHGMICNFFFADTAQHATELYHQGIDAVLTNFANRVLPVVRAERATQ